MLLAAFGCWAGASRAQGTITAALPPDTVAGHAQLLHIFSESLCEKLHAASQRLDFKQLPTGESDKLLKKLTNEVVLENRPRFLAIRKQVARPQRRLYFSLLGREALLRMADTCPAAPVLLTDLNYDGLTDKSPLSEAERAVLLPIADDVCQRVAAEEGRQPLASRPIAETKLVIGVAIRESILAHAPQLASYYGEGIMDDAPRLGNASERMGLLLFGRCPRYLLMLSLRPAKDKE